MFSPTWVSLLGAERDGLGPLRGHELSPSYCSFAEDGFERPIEQIQKTAAMYRSNQYDGGDTTDTVHSATDPAFRAIAPIALTVRACRRRHSWAQRSGGGIVHLGFWRERGPG